MTSTLIGGLNSVLFESMFYTKHAACQTWGMTLACGSYFTFLCSHHLLACFITKQIMSKPFLFVNSKAVAITHECFHWFKQHGIHVWEYQAQSLQMLMSSSAFFVYVCVCAALTLSTLSVPSSKCNSSQRYPHSSLCQFWEFRGTSRQYHLLMIFFILVTCLLGNALVL